MSKNEHFSRFSNPSNGAKYVPNVIAHIPKVYWIFLGTFTAHKRFINWFQNVQKCEGFGFVKFWLKSDCIIMHIHSPFTANQKMVYFCISSRKQKKGEKEKEMAETGIEPCTSHFSS